MIMEIKNVAQSCLKKCLVQKYNKSVVYKQFTCMLKILRCENYEMRLPAMQESKDTSHIKNLTPHVNETVNYCKKR
jgi:hypothetical protein